MKTCSSTRSCASTPNLDFDLDLDETRAVRRSLKSRFVPGNRRQLPSPLHLSHPLALGDHDGADLIHPLAGE